MAPLVIFPDDSVKVNWSVSGRPTLLVYDRHGGKDTLYRQFTLSVRKNGKEVGRHVQVQVLSKGDTDIVAFLTIPKNDSLVAAGIKNTARWGTGAAISKIINNNGRAIDIVHGGRTIHLEAGEQANNSLDGTFVSGPWTLQTFMSPQEKSDRTKRPDRLSLLITIKPN